MVFVFMFRESCQIFHFVLRTSEDGEDCSQDSMHEFLKDFVLHVSGLNFFLRFLERP